MIIKIDHIALSSKDFETDSAFLNTWGYESKIIGKNLPNRDIKKNLLQVFTADHDLAILSSEGSIDIELTNHNNINACKQYIYPILENLDRNDISDGPEKNLCGTTLSEVRIDHLRLSAYSLWNDTKKDVKFNKIAIKVNSVKKSLEFWKILGFKQIMQDETGAILEFSSLFSNQNYSIYLEMMSGAENTHKLDDHGFNSVALISTDAEKEKKALESQGYETTSTGILEVNNKKLKIFFTKGPSGEIVEIIEFLKETPEAVSRNQNE